MDKGHFYYLTDEYFSDFNDKHLMQNNEIKDGKSHDRPCFFAFTESKTGIFWMIPVSSRIDKYREHYNDKIARFGRCDTIMFGDIMGHEKAFLIQNMCPATEKYINNEYIDRTMQIPVRVDGAFEKNLIARAKKVLSLQRKGYKLIFPDVLGIEKILITQQSE